MQNSSFQNFRPHFLIKYGSLLFRLPHCQHSICPVKASSLMAKDNSECVAWYWTSPSRSLLNTGTNLQVSFIFFPGFWPATHNILSFGLWFTFQDHADNSSETEVQAARTLPCKGTRVILINSLQHIGLHFPPVSHLCCYIFLCCYISSSGNLELWNRQCGSGGGGAWAEGVWQSWVPAPVPVICDLCGPGQTNEIFAAYSVSFAKWR